MSADLDFDQGYCIHCDQVGVTAETLECPEMRTTYKIDQGFGDWPGNHIMRRLDAPPDGDTVVVLPAEHCPPAA